MEVGTRLVVGRLGFHSGKDRFFTRNHFGLVFLSAARVPAGRDERKSKDPEDVSTCHTASGSSLENIFSETPLTGKIEEDRSPFELKVSCSFTADM